MTELTGRSSAAEPTKAEPMIKTVTAGSGFCVFAKPEQDALIINRVRAGQPFTILLGERSANWVVVRVDQLEGWAMAQDISIVTPVEIARGLGFRGSYWQVFFTSPRPKDGAPNEFGIDARLANAIGNCKKSLDIAVSYIDDHIISDAIREAHSRGVKVRIVADELSLQRTDITLDELQQSGIPIVLYPGRRMHCRFSILDGSSVWAGSWNYTDSDTFNNNASVIVIENDEISSVFKAKFDQLFDDGLNRRKHEPRNGAGSPKGLRRSLPYGVKVYFGPEDDPLKELIAVANSAKKSIKFMTMSFVDEELAEALNKKAAEGLAVRGITEGAWSRKVFEKFVVGHAQPKMDLRIDDNARFLQLNCMIVDDALVMVGSMNYSRVGRTRNAAENIVAIPDRALTVTFANEFERLWGYAKLPAPGAKFPPPYGVLPD